MNAIDALKTALRISDQGMIRLVEDMRDAALTSPTPRGGNHPWWVLGHITFVEGSVPQILYAEPNPVERWAPLFAPGTEPTANADDYPPFDELLRTYRELRTRNLEILDRVGEAGLEKPTVAPPRGLENLLDTFGNTFLVIALHQMNHRGQVADARRAAGRQPLFTPGG